MGEQENIFVECGADLNHFKYKFRRKQFMWPSQTELFRQHYNNIGVYQTVMHYIDPVWMQDDKGKVVIDAAKSLKFGNFYLDFDYPITSDEDYQKIKADVLKAIRYLTIILSIDISQIQFFFSGNKGIHLVVDAAVMGLKPHQALNEVYRDIAKDIAKFCENETIDLRVYDNKRMFRMPNSVNKKSGLYKVPLTVKEFKECKYQDILEIAKSPREIKAPTVIFSPKAKQAFEKYVDSWTERLENVEKFDGKIKELKVLPPCIKRMQEKVFKETIDERNNSATALTNFYFQQGMEKEEALHRMTIWGEENCVPSLKRNEIEVVVNSVYRGHYRYGCQTFKELSGVCEREICPLFNDAFNVSEGEQNAE
ncbi:primase C-terminal domain-containing protein [Oceanobacillus profundus]|uniref:primase C-terminal domain-containing protein n=1 Tax=Oceanobacillus profundus TaxID=372463 RepID=UPI001F022855|nr:primase C-terminal domain-containing protein [Oceanobacillus profundus]